MMPPKKSKAARSVNQDEPVTEQTETNGKAENKPEQNINIFDVEIVKGKRPRKILPIEQNLTDWIENHLEERPGNALVLSDAYKYYVDSCVSANSVAPSLPEFCKAVKEKFPRGIAVKDSSPFACLVRVKKDKGQKSKTASVKVKDVIFKIIEELGNPHKGVRYPMIKQQICKKYPELGLDKRPRFLLAALERCIHYRQLQLVRGVGMCGLYRLFGPSKSDDEEDKENHKTEEASEDQEEDTEEGEEKQKNKQSKPAVQKKSRKTKKAQRVNYSSVIVHSAPQRIEDAFMLALTFMVEPKEASVKKILKYITEYYDKDLSIERLRKCLEKGCEKGYWQQVTGQGLSGTIRLLMNKCDPSADDDLVGQVTNALIACTEPKQCSATLLKSYLIEYHPEFDIQNKPYLFKKALERALKKNIIRQLRGIGASGSFQLNKTFTPSPIILRGEDTEKDYEVSDDDASGPFSIASFQNAYQPRPTKSRGHGRQASKGISSETLAGPATKIDKAKSGGVMSARRRKPVYYGEDETIKMHVKKHSKKKSSRTSMKRQHEDTESKDVMPVEKKRKSGKKSAAKKRSQPKSKKVEEKAFLEEESPKKKASSKSAKRDAGRQETPLKRKPIKSYKEISSAEDDDEDDGGEEIRKASPYKAISSVKKSLVKSYEEASSDDDDDDDELEKGKKRVSSKSAKRDEGPPARRSLVKSYEEINDEDDDDYIDASPKKVKKSQKSAKRHRDGKERKQQVREHSASSRSERSRRKLNVSYAEDSDISDESDSNY